MEKKNFDVKLREFSADDIPLKVKWINDEKNNQFLHYDLPISIEGTRQWFRNIENRTDRVDLTVVVNDIPVGILGLLNIDFRNKKAEFYICIGEHQFKGQGIAKEASVQLIQLARKKYSLNRIYLFTETENLTAQKLFEQLGFIKEGLLKQDLLSREGRVIDRFLYALILH